MDTQETLVLRAYFFSTAGMSLVKLKFVVTHNIFKISCRDMCVLIAYLFKIDQLRLQNPTKRTYKLYELNTC